MERRSLLARPHRVVMGKGLDQQIADRDSIPVPGTKDSPVFVLGPGAEAQSNGLGRLRVAINRNGKFPAKHFQPANVIAMLMGKKKIQLLGATPHCSSRTTSLARA